MLQGMEPERVPRCWVGELIESSRAMIVSEVLVKLGVTYLLAGKGLHLTVGIWVLISWRNLASHTWRSRCISLRSSRSWSSG